MILVCENIHRTTKDSNPAYAGPGLTPQKSKVLKYFQQVTQGQQELYHEQYPHCPK